MASSSSTASVQKSFKYDVFLSFRGEDTRKTFVDHLYHALHQKSIHTYKDDERIKKGERISDELIKSIEDSKFYIIVFSRNYASSSWCLDELVKIMECQKTTEHTAYPVFYDVDTTEVRKQSGEFGKAFAKQEKKEAVNKWREALKEAANLSGFGLKNTADGHEAKFIQKIVEVISLELRSNNLRVDEKLIGMEARIKDVVSSLELGSNDVRMIGIKGMGGGGKTTLARAIFDQISFQFEGSTFVHNVRENSKPNLCGLRKLQKQVLKDVLNDRGTNISTVHDGKRMLKRMLCCRKVLVVLDDVNHIDQLKALAGDLNWFNKGSRIIITTRDEQVLVAHQVKLIHNVNLLSNEEAIELLSRYAFRGESPIPWYKELVRKVVDYAAGLPLTITVLGLFLCGKNELEWKDVIERLKTIPLRETLQKLELSYMGLEDDYKEIFLDVACMMKGWEKEDAIRVLECCGFHARSGLKVLEQKSLITINSKYGSAFDECLDMHDHIEEMGKNIVRRLHPNEPNKHSRLWIREEIEDILANNQGTEATTCIHLVEPEVLSAELFMKGLGNMKNLRYLHVDLESNESNWKFDEDIQYFPSALRYLSWDKYPFGSLPKTFQANNLVALEMYGSKMVQLWEGGERKVLKKLRFFKFEDSNLKSLDLGLTPNLEKLNLEDCVDLVELHIPLECLKIKFLSVVRMKLRTLDLRGTPNLETLSLKECYDLVELSIPVECLQLKTLEIRSCKLRTLHLQGTSYLEKLNLVRCDNLVEVHILVECQRLNIDSCNKLRKLDLQRTPYLRILNLMGCHDLVELHMPVECRLKHMSAIGCSKLKTLDLRGTPCLETLSLIGCHNLVEIHIHADCLLKLESLNIIDSSKLRTLDLRGAPNLEKVHLRECVNLVELHIRVDCLSLVSLDLGSSKLRTLDLRGAPYLEKVRLGECVDLVELHIPVDCLRLISLDLGSSKLRTLDLRGAPNLEKLSLGECVDLVEIRIPIECCIKLRSLDINYSKLRTLDLRGTPYLETLSLRGCYDLVELHIPVKCLTLESINIMGAKLRTLDLGWTPNLKRLSLTECRHLVKVHTHDGCLKKLDYMDLRGCLRFNYFSFIRSVEPVEVGCVSKLHLVAESLEMCPLHFRNNLPKFRFACFYEEHGPTLIGNLEKLISFGLCACTNLERFSQSICGLQCLTKLTLERSIPEVPKDLDRLECLEELHLLSTKITHLPDNICMLRHLKCLKLNRCSLLEKLPEDLGRLECLEMLILSHCVFLQDIPDSICEMKCLRILQLRYCVAIEKLPEELGRLECLKELNIEGTSIRHLPQSIFELKGLRIIGFRWLLQSCGFTSEIQISEDETFCYVEL